MAGPHTVERADTNRFELTKEFVAQMVGAPRPAVSESVSTPRKKGIIDYRRGVLTIRNAKRPHKVACECFDVVSHSANGGISTWLADLKRSPASGKDSNATDSA